MSETQNQLLEALKPFAELGLAFGERHNPDGASPWDRTPDDFEIQVGASSQSGWAMTAGQLRRAARLYYSLCEDEAS